MKFIGLPNYVCLVCDSNGIEIFGPKRDQFRCKDCRVGLDASKAKAIIGDGFRESLLDIMAVDEIVNDAKIAEILEHIKSDEETM